MRDVMAVYPETETKTTVERRRALRAPVTVRVEYATVDAFFSEFSRNINEGGMFVESEQPLELEEIVSLQFRLPGSDETLKVRGRVAHVSRGEGGEPPGMGIEFDGLSPKDRATINQVVRALRNAPA